MNKIINSGEDWSFEKLEWIYTEIEKIALEKYQLNTYSNSIEIISFEQMLDAYSRVAMPLGYDHWSFGETYVKQSHAYKHNQMGLAYEIVSNTNPTINYLMDSNTLLMQTLVMAHAGFGHNHVFKNNYLFKEWTDASSIIDYLSYAKKYIKKCEEQYGHKNVEAFLDAAHALRANGMDRYKRPKKLSVIEEEARLELREKELQKDVNEFWNHVKTESVNKKQKFPKDPEENILYFLEKNAPKLQTWQREILRIVRKISQYFFPQMQTNLIHEGFATYIHYKIIHDLYDKKFISDGAMLEFYASHSGVIYQPDYTKSNQINVYALGFKMCKDIERISLNPTEEDRKWFKSQDWIGNGKPYDNIKYAVANFNNESFVMQYLSPTVMRDMGLFCLNNDDSKDYYEITAIHNEQGYRNVRNALAKQYDLNSTIPNIQIVDVNMMSDRTMYLEHTICDDKLLDEKEASKTLDYLAWIWGYPIKLTSKTQTGEEVQLWENIPIPTSLGADQLDYSI